MKLGTRLDRLALVGIGLAGLYYVPHLTGVLAAVLLPTFIAHYRKHRNRLAITVLNLVMAALTVLSFGTAALLGVMVVFPVGIGWVISLIWACTANVEPAEIS